MAIDIDVAAVVQSDTRIVVEVSGPVDTFTCAPLVEALRWAVRYREVIVDLTRVTHFSAAGVHALEAAEQALAERGGLLRLVAVEAGLVNVVLRALGMQGRWQVVGQEPDAHGQGQGEER